MRAVKAAHDRRTKLTMLQLLTIIHPADARARQRELLASLAPAAVETPFGALVRRAHEQQAARTAAL